MAATPLECYRKVQIYDRGASYTYRYGFYNFGESFEAWHAYLQDCRDRIDREYDEGWEACQCSCTRCSQPVLVKDENDVVLSGVTITASPNFTNIWLEPSRTCTTGADGKCSPPDLVAGKSYTLTVTPPSGLSCVNPSSCKFTISACETEKAFILSALPAIAILLDALPILSASVTPPAFTLAPITFDTIPPLSASASLPPVVSLPSVTFETIPSLSSSVSLLTFSLPPISLEALPSLLATVSLPPEISVPLDTIPSLSSSVSLGVVITLPAFVFDSVPSLSPFIHLPFSYPASPLASAIIAQNQENLAGAFIERTADFKIIGWTAPPFICFICGATLYSEGDFITHMTEHLTAYEEGEE